MSVCPTCHGPMKPLFGTKEFCPNDCDRPGGGPKAKVEYPVRHFDQASGKTWEVRRILAGSSRSSVINLYKDFKRGFWIERGGDIIKGILVANGPAYTPGKPGWDFPASMGDFLSTNDLLVFKEVT